MVQSYSVFCSHHNESINIYKEQLQNNKKMQILMRVRELHLVSWPLLSGTKQLRGDGVKVSDE